MSATPRCVERGAELLDDQLGPDWDERIDLRTLDLASSCNCVLGQLYRPGRGIPRWKGYWRGRDALGIETPSRFGFETWGSQSFASLTAAWTRLIERRRAARAWGA